jgi:hypothetical protein
MKGKLLNLIVLCLLAGLVVGCIPTAVNAQDGTKQRPQLLIKVRNIGQLLSDIDKLMQPAKGSTSLQPTAMARLALQGTDWIDPNRSIVAGITMKDATSKCIVLIPFLTANPLFQVTSGAIAGENYYLLAYPPEPGFTIDPAIKESLLNASTTATTGSLVAEIAVGPYLDMLETQLAAVMKQAGTFPQVQTAPSPLSPQDVQDMLTGVLKTLRQADTLRYSLDLSDNTLTLRLSIDAIPNTQLAFAWTDSGGDSRLMNYSTDMPIQYRSRAHNMTGALDLMQSGLGTFYRKIGIDLGAMGDIVKNFTGETAGGMNISPDGLVLKTISVLQPGIDGQAFLLNTFLPWFEDYNRQISNLAAQQTGKTPVPTYVRTADSIVADNIKAIGMKSSANPILNNKAFEIRMAAVGDLLFMASDDAKLESLINGSRSLTKSSSSGSMFQLDLQLGSIIKGFLAAFGPNDVGNFNMTVNVDMTNGKLAAQTSLNIADLRKLSEAFSSMISKQALLPTGVHSPNFAVK